MGNSARAATPTEIEAMARSVKRAMGDGALGLSYGRPYLPGRFAESAELNALAKTVVPSDGVATWHIRDEGLHGIESLDEALEVGRATHVRTHISHFKSSGPSQWQHLSDRLALVARARTGGVRVTIDAYPYDRSSTTTDVLLPDWALSDNRAALRRAQHDKAIDRKLTSDISALAAGAGWHDFRFVTIVSGRRDWLGRTVADLVEATPGRDADTFEKQAKVLIDISARGGAQAVFADMAESDVALAIADDEAAFGSDSAVRDPGTVRPVHPRGLGTFPRVFRKYVRETATLTIENAVRKASALAADIFGLADRGRIAQGAWADLVVFDPKRITDRATYEEPLSEPDGIDYVVVNGTVVMDHGSFTREPPAGMAVRRSRPSSRPSLTRRLVVQIRTWATDGWRLHSQTRGS